ncbi:hypothetical protein [Nautilia sp.]
MKHKVLLSVIAVGLLFMSGCGSNSEESTNTPSTEMSSVSGIAADGYIKGAKVCIDLNENTQCDMGEPVSTTDENGKYTINYEDDYRGKPLIVIGGFDIERNVEFNSTLISVLEDENVNITPLTTFAYIYAKSKGVTFATAKQETAHILGIDENKIDADPESDKDLKKLSLKIQLIVETAAKLQNKNVLDMYEMLASKAAKDKNLTEIINESFNQNILAAIEVIESKLDEVSISDIQNIQGMVINIVANAIKSNITVTAEMIENRMLSLESLNKLNLSKTNFENKINSLMAEVKANANNSATIDDAKNMVSNIRDIIYEFIDPNVDKQDQNDSTLAGEVVSNYNNAVKPAIDNLNDDINSSFNLVDEAAKKFNEDLNNEFNETFSDLNDRLKAIADGINGHEKNENYNFTTMYGDTVSHTYSNENGYITETYTLNGQSLTARYYDEKATNAYLATDPIALRKEGEYDVSINSLNFDGSRFIFDVNGVLYDKNDNSKKIEISNAKVSCNINTAQGDKKIDEILAFSNIDASMDVNITTNNGSFNGEIEFNDGDKHLIGTLDYSSFNGVKLNGILTLNANTSDLLEIANDGENKYDGWEREEIILVDGKLVVKREKDDLENGTYEENLTTIYGETAHCVIRDIWGEDTHSHIVNCDKNVTSMPIYDKVVEAEINGKEVYLDNIRGWGDWNNIAYSYEFGGENDIYYEIWYDYYNDIVEYFSNETGDNPFTVSNITVKEPKDVLDISGDVKFKGNVTTPKLNISLTLVAQSKGDGKTYHIIANDVNITNDKNFVTIGLVDVANEKQELSEFSYYSNYIIESFDEDEGDKTTNVLLQGLNATLYDTNGNPITVKDMNVLADLNNKNGYMYGALSHLDFSMSGFASYSENETYKFVEMYMNIERTGYAPFILGAYASFNDYNSDIKSIIEKGDYSIYLHQIYNDVDDGNLNIDGFDSNGVFIKVSEEGDNEANVTLTDKDEKSLATYDPITQNVTYSDGTSETLY